MSRVYFHSPSGDAEIRGSELAWLGQVAAGLGTYAWNLDRVGAECTRAYRLMEMSPERDPGALGNDYLHVYMREAQAEEHRWREAYREYEASGRPYGPLGGPRFNPEHQCRFLEALSTKLRVDGLKLDLAGRQMNTRDIQLNTALVFGSDVIALAAKIYGWCEQHAFVEGTERAWLADLIQQGLDAGIYRRGLWYTGARDDERKWLTQGWEELIVFLRARDDEPVVMSYSIGDQFPDRRFADWEPPELPADWRASWADDEQGIAEWEALDEDDKASYRKEAIAEAWNELPAGEQWERAMRGLREKLPWARLTPESLRTEGFGPLVTVYDLFAEDRDERIARAFTSEDEREETLSLTEK